MNPQEVGETWVLADLPTLWVYSTLTD